MTEQPHGSDAPPGASTVGCQCGDSRIVPGQPSTNRHSALGVGPFVRTVVIGNSGSGKSTLAERLAALANIPAIDLDLLHWEDNGSAAKRAEAVARQMVHEAAAQPSWVIEGVYGGLAEVAIPRATALIWLDVPWSVCRDSLLARGVRRGGTDADFAELMTWAEAYWERQTSSSFGGHLRLFDRFPRTRLRLRDRQEAHQFLVDLELERLQARTPS